MPVLKHDAIGQSKKEFVESVIEICKVIFNDASGLDFSKNDCLKIAFCTFENRAAVYEDFCKRFFPLYLAEYYNRNIIFTAQAFTNVDDEIYGILICLDMEQEDSDWYQIILHEMSHIFCITHEIARDNFTAKYLNDTTSKTLKNITLHVGYAIWREFIADHIAYQLNPFIRPLSLTELRKGVRELDAKICLDNPDQAENISQVLTRIFAASRIQKAADIEDVFQVLKRNRIFSSQKRCEQYRELISLIFRQLEEEYFWEITPQFIERIGRSCSSLYC